MSPPGSMRPRILCAIAALANCITAGSINTFPLWSTPLARSLHLTSSQLNLLASSAILGEYAMAGPWGAIADSYGPGAVSIGAGVCFGIGYGLLGLVAKVGAQLDKQGKENNHLLWVLLCGTYFLAGCGVAASYFSAMIASTKSIPARHSGLAIGVPCAVFGLSPLFLTSLASFFTTTWDRFPEPPGTAQVELDPGKWLLFLAAMLALVNGIGGFFLKELPWQEDQDQLDPAKRDSQRMEAERQPEDPVATERTALLPARASQDQTDSPSSAIEGHQPEALDPQTLRQFVSTPRFWLFGSLILLSTGPVEMYMASLGQILESLLAISASTTSTASHALQARKNHIAVLAIANTFSRLGVGAVSDYLSTPAREGERPKRRISRLVFLFGACATLAASYAWGGTGLGSEQGLWVITIVNGFSYGAIFTLSPAIVRSCWPVDNFGRNWGLLTWFSAIGALIFTPLFGILRDMATGTSAPLTLITEVCAASSCYRPIFVVSAVSAGAAGGVVLLLWRKWNLLV
ncbi:uncharacterized protein JCM15063_001084 [Sporobolomyces koalae]|uniref:uncharacterized protein n=1 Tax=Sporobolomyces koalae TaxID=500713 RepID=UPI00316F8262